MDDATKESINQFIELNTPRRCTGVFTFSDTSENLVKFVSTNVIASDDSDASNSMGPKTSEMQRAYVQMSGIPSCRILCRIVWHPEIARRGITQSGISS